MRITRCPDLAKHRLRSDVVALSIAGSIGVEMGVVVKSPAGAYDGDSLTPQSVLSNIVDIPSGS